MEGAILFISCFVFSFLIVFGAIQFGKKVAEWEIKEWKDNLKKEGLPDVNLKIDMPPVKIPKFTNGEGNHVNVNDLPGYESNLKNVKVLLIDKNAIIFTDKAKYEAHCKKYVNYKNNPKPKAPGLKTINENSIPKKPKWKNKY